MTGPIEDIETVKTKARACRVCAPSLPHTPRPVLRGAQGARILIIGQAPGTRVHESGTPFTDPSGDRLRDWMGVDTETFYDEAKIAIAPMGFCFPGLNEKGADLPPRPECAPLWQHRVRAALADIALTLLVGGYAQKFHLGAAAKAGVTDTVARWRAFAPEIFALPHPSWRNNAWIKRNPWFEGEVLPALRLRIRNILADP